MSSNRTQVAAKPTKTVDFGAPTAYGEHMFRVEIPGSRKDPVLIVEDFGLLGQDARLTDEPRAVVKRTAWLSIADAARRDFNERLKAAEHPDRPLARRLEPGRAPARQGTLCPGVGDGDRECCRDAGHLQQVGGAPPRGALVAVFDDSGRGGPPRRHDARLAPCALLRALRL